jgi:hypothetical protein
MTDPSKPFTFSALPPRSDDQDRHDYVNAALEAALSIADETMEWVAMCDPERTEQVEPPEEPPAKEGHSKQADPSKEEDDGHPNR